MVISNKSVPPLPRRYLIEVFNRFQLNEKKDTYGILSLMNLVDSVGGRNRLGDVKIDAT